MERGKVVPYYEGLPLIKSRNPLNFFEIMWQIKSVLSPRFISTDTMPEATRVGGVVTYNHGQGIWDKL